jgi:hypothetical protein
MATNFLRYAGTSNNGLLTSLLTLMTTELESVANAGTAISSVGGTSGLFTNSNTGQAIWGELFFGVGNPAFTAVAGGNLTGWWLTSPDGGTTFEYETTGGSGIPPGRAPDWIIPGPGAVAVPTGSVLKSGVVRVPALAFKVYIQNNMGATLGAGSTTVPFLKLAPCADQY